MAHHFEQQEVALMRLESFYSFQEIASCPETYNMMLEEKNLNSFSSKPNIKHEKEMHELSPIALMKHRIEEMYRKLFEKRNQRK